jgi:hypothetical protein
VYDLANAAAGSPAGLLQSLIGNEHDHAGDLTMRGLISIVIGVVFIWGGLSGNMALRGTKNGPALAVVGVFLIGLGIFRMTRKT